jgi:hypothetical protein
MFFFALFVFPFVIFAFFHAARTEPLALPTAH